VAVTSSGVPGMPSRDAGVSPGAACTARRVSADVVDKLTGAGRSAGVSADIGSASLPPVSAGATLGLVFLFGRFHPAGLSTEDPLVGSSAGGLLVGSSPLVSGDTLPSLALSPEQSLNPLSSSLDSQC